MPRTDTEYAELALAAYNAALTGKDTPDVAWLYATNTLLTAHLEDLAAQAGDLEGLTEAGRSAYEESWNAPDWSCDEAEIKRVRAITAPLMAQNELWKAQNDANAEENEHLRETNRNQFERIVDLEAAPLMARVKELEALLEIYNERLNGQSDSFKPDWAGYRQHQAERDGLKIRAEAAEARVKELYECRYEPDKLLVMLERYHAAKALAHGKKETGNG